MIRPIILIEPLHRVILHIAKVNITKSSNIAINITTNVTSVVTAKMQSPILSSRSS